MAYGTNAALDTLASLNNTLVADIGEDTRLERDPAGARRSTTGSRTR
jgi:hypothetical protein